MVTPFLPPPPPPESRAVYEIIWKNCGKAGQATDGNITRRMRFAFWIINAADTHSEYVILIAVSLQQWSCERALVLRYAYIACLVMLFYCSQRYDSN